jgi:hypothetical protein
MRKNTKRSAVIAGVATVIIGGGVAAWAANGWSLTGTGSGEAQAAQIHPLTATTSLGDKTIYPGAKVTATTSVNNPNEFGVKLDTSVKATNVTLSSGQTNSCTDVLNQALNTPGTSGAIVASFPTTPTILAKQSTSVASSVVIPMELPQSCAGSRLKISYSFTGVSQADA